MAIAAAVDIGTNSVKVVVGGLENGRLRVLEDRTRVTRLGKGVDQTGRLDDEAIERTLGGLAEFAALARQHGAAGIAAVGTSALRDAANGAEFVARAEQALGGTQERPVRVEIISGDREAHLIYTAARRDPDLALPQTGALAVMDIGGGSTEFVLGRDGALCFRDSLQIGAVRLTERALPGDPPDEAAVERAIALADAVFAAVPAPDRSALEGNAEITLVGSGGTIANLAAMERGLAEFRPEALHGTRLRRDQIEARVGSLAGQTVAERRGVAGLDPARADIILAGAILQARAMHRLGVEAIIVNLRSLRFGLLYELSEGETKHQP